MQVSGVSSPRSSSVQSSLVKAYRTCQVCPFRLLQKCYADFIREALNSIRGHRPRMEACYQQASTWQMFQNSSMSVIVPDVRTVMKAIQKRDERATVLVVGSTYTAGMFRYILTQDRKTQEELLAS